MAKSRQYRAILPILNDDFATYPGKPWWIADDLRLGTLSEIEARLISEGVPHDFEHRVEVGQKCLYLTGLPGGQYDRIKKEQAMVIQTVALCAQATFNLVGGWAAMAIPYGVVISEATIMRYKEVYELEVWGNPLAIRRQRYRVKTGIEKQEIQHLFEVTKQVVTDFPSLRITLNRFCAALLKSNPEDKLIDLTIALESLIPGGGEFGFRFPYYLALLVDRDAGKRKRAYSQLKALYSARSGLVHGAADRSRDLNNSRANWSSLVRYAIQCIIYRLEFAYTSPDAKWDEHLLDLAYAGEPII